MKLLEKTAPEVHQEFLRGNFVVKWTKRRFNQVPADQATEWINKTCKMHNGIIGITRNDQARDKFCVTWSERSRITQCTRSLFNLEDDEDDTTFTRSDSLPTQRNRDIADVKSLKKQLKAYKVFQERTTLTESDSATSNPEACEIPLLSLATRDAATSDVTRDLLTAEARGKEHVKAFVELHLTEENAGFHEPLTKHRSKTFADLYKTPVSTKQTVQKTFKADRKLLQRLLTAITSGRAIDLC